MGAFLSSHAQHVEEAATATPLQSLQQPHTAALFFPLTHHSRIVRLLLRCCWCSSLEGLQHRALLLGSSARAPALGLQTTSTHRLCKCCAACKAPMAMHASVSISFLQTPCTALMCKQIPPGACGVHRCAPLAPLAASKHTNQCRMLPAATATPSRCACHMHPSCSREGSGQALADMDGGCAAAGCIIPLTQGSCLRNVGRVDEHSAALHGTHCRRAVATQA